MPWADRVLRSAGTAPAPELRPAHWELAKELKRPILHCIEYDLSETEALEWLLQRHRRSTGLNDYARIILALDLEPELSEIARANKQIGGQQKGLSNLTKAEQVHVRSEIARAAGVFGAKRHQSETAQ